MKYQRFTPAGYKDIVIRKIDFVAKTPLIYEDVLYPLHPIHHQTQK